MKLGEKNCGKKGHLLPINLLEMTADEEEEKGEGKENQMAKM